MKVEQNDFVIIVLVLIVQQINICFIAGQCTVDEHGRYECQCHCNACQNQTCFFGCKEGWYGSEEYLCQKQNVLRNKQMTYQLTSLNGHPPDNAVDGNMSTSARTSNNINQYWYIQVEYPQRVQWVVIKQQGGGTLDIHIVKKMSTKLKFGNATLCTSISVGPNVSIIDVACTEIMYGDTLTVVRPGEGYLYLQEVHAYSCTNGTDGKNCIPLREAITDIFQIKPGSNETRQNDTIPCNGSDMHMQWIITGCTLGTLVPVLIIILIMCIRNNHNKKENTSLMSTQIIEFDNLTVQAEATIETSLRGSIGDNDEVTEVKGYESLTLPGQGETSTSACGYSDHCYERIKSSDNGSIISNRTSTGSNCPYEKMNMRRSFE